MGVPPGKLIFPKRDALGGGRSVGPVGKTAWPKSEVEKNITEGANLSVIDTPIRSLPLRETAGKPVSFK